MSAVYNSFREQLMDWLLNGGWPADAVPYVAGVDSSYVFDAAHSSIADLGLSGVIDAVELLGFTFAGGVLDANDLALTGLDIGPTVDALVVFFGWTGGDQLVCYIDSATDASLPQQIVTGKLNIEWNIAGICKI